MFAHVLTLTTPIFFSTACAVFHTVSLLHQKPYHCNTNMLWWRKLGLKVQSKSRTRCSGVNKASNVQYNGRRNPWDANHRKTTAIHDRKRTKRPRCSAVDLMMIRAWYESSRTRSFVELASFGDAFWNRNRASRAPAGFQIRSLCEMASKRKWDSSKTVPMRCQEKRHSSHTKHCAFTKVFFSDSLSFCDFFVLRLLLAIVLILDLCNSEVSELDFLWWDGWCWQGWSCDKLTSSQSHLSTSLQQLVKDVEVPLSSCLKHNPWPGSVLWCLLQQVAAANPFLQLLLQPKQIFPGKNPAAWRKRVLHWKSL